MTQDQASSLSLSACAVFIVQYEFEHVWFKVSLFHLVCGSKIH